MNGDAESSCWTIVCFPVFAQQLLKCVIGVARSNKCQCVGAWSYDFKVELPRFCAYHAPITPIFNSRDADRFWEAARALGPVGLLVTQGLSWGDMLNEQARLRHYQAEGSVKQ